MVVEHQIKQTQEKQMIYIDQLKSFLWLNHCPDFPEKCQNTIPPNVSYLFKGMTSYCDSATRIHSEFMNLKFRTLRRKLRNGGWRKKNLPIHSYQMVTFFKDASKRFKAQITPGPKPPKPPKSIRGLFT